MIKEEVHKHNFKKLGFVNEVGTVSRSNKLVPDVGTRFIDRIILTRSCDCGASQAFECGEKEVMRTLYARLKGG